MKNLLTMMFVLLLIAGVAGVALAQEGDQEPEQTKTRHLNWEDAPGVDANGGIHRWGAEFAELGGPHGPFGTAGDEDAAMFIDEDGDGFDDAAKAFGEDCDGEQVQAGDLERERHLHGPREAGPHSDAEGGFGEPSDQDKGDGEAVRTRGAGKR